jgi:hypothetical protein
MEWKLFVSLLLACLLCCGLDTTELSLPDGGLNNCG